MWLVFKPRDKGLIKIIRSLARKLSYNYYKVNNYNRSAYRDSSRGKYNNWKKKDDYKDKSYLYVPPRSLNTDLNNSRMEHMLEKGVKGVEKMKDYFKELRKDI